MVRNIAVIVAFLALLSACQQSRRSGVTTTVVPPPDKAPEVAYTFRSMNTVATVAEGLATFVMELDVVSFKNEWQTIRLFSPDIPVTETEALSGNVSAAMVTKNGEGYHLVLGEAGNYRVRIEFVRTVREENGRKSVAIPFVPALTSLCRFSIPETPIKVTVASGINYGVKAAEKGTDVLLFGVSAPETTLAWQGRSADDDLPPVVIANHYRLVTVNRGSAIVKSFCHFDVTQGQCASFVFAIGAETSVLEVKGANVRSWSIAGDGESRQLTVLLGEEAGRKYDLTVTTEHPTGGIPSTFALPRLAVQGTREKGIVAVSLQKGVNAEVAARNNALQIDVAELPEELRGGDGRTALAFKYVDGEPGISLNLSDVLPKISAETMTSVKVSKDFLAVVSRINFTIRDAGVFRFSIRLPEGLKVSNVVGANINTWQVKDDRLIVDLRSKSEGAYTLVLETERMVTNPDGVAVDLPEILNVEREVGYITISAAPAVKVELVGLEGLRQISPNDLPGVTPSTDREGKGAPQEKIDLAFRYLKHPFTLRVNALDITPDVEAVVNAHYAVHERNLQMSAVVTYNILKSGIFSLKLRVSPGLKITSLTGKGIDDWKHDEKEGTLIVILREKTEGTYVVTVVGEQSLADGAAGLEIPFLQALEIKKERGMLAFVPDAAFRLKTDAVGTSDILEMDIKDLPPELSGRGNVVLAYKYFEHPWKLRVAVERIKSRVTAEIFNLISVGDGIVHHGATINYDVLYAGVAQFRVKLPPGVKRVDIDGANIKHREERKAEDGDEWTITLHSQVLGRYPIYITFQRDLDMKGGNVLFDFSGVRALDAERETGYIGLAARPDIQVAGDGIRTEGLTPIDAREIPATYTNGIAAPFLSAYRYIGHPYRMDVPIIRHQHAGVLVAIIENGLLSTTVTEEGQTVTDIILQGRNSREPYLKVLLPPGAEIWHLFVNKEEVTPYTSSTPSAAGRETLIPLRKKGETGEAFEVRIRYGIKREALGATGEMEMVCPGFNIPVMKLGWALFLPDEYESLTVAGNMRAVSFLDPALMQIMSGQSLVLHPGKDAAATPSPEPGRDIQGEKNKWVMENLAVNAGGGSGGIRQGVDTGNKPSGRRACYFQTLIPMRETGHIAVRYAKESLGQISRVAVVLLIAVGSLLFWRKTRLSIAVKIGTMTVCVLALMTMHTLWSDGIRTDHLTIAAWTMALMTLIMLAGEIATALWTIWRRSQRESGVPAKVEAVATSGESSSVAN